MMRAGAGRVARDTRSVGLLISAFVCITRGFAYTPAALRPESPPPAFSILVDAGVPGWVFGVLWFIGAGVLILEAVRRTRDWRLFVVAVAVPLVWGFSYLGASLFDHSSGWLTGAIYLALMGYIVCFGLGPVRH